jgi:two-component system chemotaxis response regulator CheB
MAIIRVVIVEDSITVRNLLREVLSSDKTIELVGEAENGKRAIEMCRALKPDVITMDMMLPVMNGLDATEYIMAHFPTPILIVSSSTNRGELFKTYEALAAGAVDVFEKPRVDEAEDIWKARFLSTLKLVARIRVITHLRARLRRLEPDSADRPVEFPRTHSQAGYAIVAIGASTGGPAAILEILRAIPTNFPLPILVVLHISEPFGTALAEWLDGQTPHRVQCAKAGDSIINGAGRVFLAPPNRHLVVHDGRLELTSDGERHSCRPSVDVLFESVAREFGPAAIACLLTGMGRDGATGLLDVRRAGGLTIAQDEATSAVFGMPREAIQLDAAERILPLQNIGPALSSLAVGKR